MAAIHVDIQAAGNRGRSYLAPGREFSLYRAAERHRVLVCA